MNELREAFIKTFKNSKYNLLDFIPLFKDFVLKNEILWEDLLFIKEKIYQVKKNDLLDDFLLEYIKITNPDFDTVIALLDYIKHPISRRIIINLINLNIINSDNLDTVCINYPEINIYYNIINNNYKFDYSIDNLAKYYRNVPCVNSDYFQFHTNQIGTIPVLNEEDELFLFFERDKGKKEAIDYLIISNLRLVRSLATTYAYKFNINDLDELYANGVLGLINAVYNYNAYTGIKFSTYATQSISRIIRRERLRDRTIYIPTDIVEGTSSRTDINILKNIENINKGILSLDASAASVEDDAVLADIISPNYDDYKDNEFLKPVDEIVELNIMIDETNKLINSLLTEDEKNIIKSYIYDEKTQKEIVALYSLNMTHQNVSLIIKKIINKLKANEEFKKLINYISNDYKEEEPKKKMSKNKNKEIIIEEQQTEKKEYINPIIDYRQITVSRLTKEFSAYSFITQEDIEQEVKTVDNIIDLKNKIIISNKMLAEELMKDHQDALKIVKIVKACVKQISLMAIGKSYSNLFRKELDFVVSVFDNYNDPKKAKKVDAMDLVYTISEINKSYDPNTLINYMSADTNLYLKVANQIRKEKEEGINDTIKIAKEDVNSHLYALVRTAHIGFYNDHTEDNIKQLLGDIIESYQGDTLMVEHVKNITKEQYELLNGIYEPPVRNNDFTEPEEDIKPGNYSEIEYYGHHMKIWDVIETDDPNYKEFLELKFKNMISFDDLVSMFDNAHRYYATAINYINADIDQKRKDNVRTIKSF